MQVHVCGFNNESIYIVILEYSEKGEDARQKIRLLKPLKKRKLGVTQTVFDPLTDIFPKDTDK